MEAASSARVTFRVLVARDISTEAATQLAEFYVPQPPYFDMCLLCGPFTHRPLVSSEDAAVAEGDLALTIAQIENIVCRVCYLASADDPASCREKQLHLTPNSVNIHGRSMLLADTLAIGGFAHCEPEHAVSDNSDDEEDAEPVAQCKEPRLNDVMSTHKTTNIQSIMVQQGGQYIPAVTDHPNLCLYICCDDDSMRNPDGCARVHKQGNALVVHPPSMARTRTYLVLGLQEGENGWTVGFTEERELLRRPVSVATLSYAPKQRRH